MKNKLPKGFRATAYKIPSGNCKGWYDIRVFKDGYIILSHSGTAFEYKEQALNCARRRAWDIFNKSPQWT